jgi:hypothetical protein
MRAWEIFSENDEAHRTRQRSQLDAARQRRSRATHQYQDEMRAAADTGKKAAEKRASAAQKYQSKIRAAHDAESRARAST